MLLLFVYVVKRSCDAPLPGMPLMLRPNTLQYTDTLAEREEKLKLEFDVREAAFRSIMIS